jgi:predicted restriction endonuclease
MKKECIICGFDKIVHEHHLHKWNDFGSDDDMNKVYVCPNHHWILDFGDEHESAQLLKEIKKKTGKSPLIDKEAKNIPNN